MLSSNILPCSFRSTPAGGLRRLLPLAAACLLPTAALFAATGDNPDSTANKTQSVTQDILDKMTPLNDIQEDAVYVGQGHFIIKDGFGPDGKTELPYKSISETDLSLEYGRRFHLFGQVYLKVAAAYERYDFSATNAPIPTSLQSLGGVVALEYIQQGEVGAFFRTAPGVYYSDFNQISRGNFNIPFSLGTILPIGKKVYVLVGLETNVLAKYPVLPVLGVIWLITDHLRVMGREPDPQLVYSVNDAIDLFIGAELNGGSYKRDYNPDYTKGNRRFSGAVLDYSETRLGGGVTYSPKKNLDLDIDFAGGWDLGQNFDFYRGESTKEFKTRGAPYARISLEANF